MRRNKFERSLKRFSKNSGNVIESLENCVYTRNLLATNLQLNIAPIARPTASHKLHWPKPAAYAAPGSPNKSHPLKSLADAEKAVTQLPKRRPPKI